MEPGFVSGRAAIEAYQAKRLQARRYVDAVITTAELGVSGDLAWETGTNRVTIQQGESAPLTVTGRYLAVWKRGADGRWRIRAELPITDPVQ
jgi:ketosteroid isomerase-like protein